MRKLALGICLLGGAIIGCGKATIIYDTVTPSTTQMVDAGQTLSLSAKVFNDPANGGVNWTMTGAGSLSGATATTVIYTAPSTVTAGATASIEALPVNNPSYAAGDQIVLSPAPAITTTTLPQGVIGTAYSAQIISTGGSAPLVFAVTSGALPAGLSLSSSGLITGTPTTATTSTFTITLTDSAATPVVLNKSYSITVIGAPLVITTASTPNAVSGTAYSAQLAVSGGVPAYTWALASGALPTGLTLSASGLLSGTPTALGSFTFTVQVTDTEPTPQTVKKIFGITVYAPLVITTTSLPAGSAHDAYSATLQTTGGTAPIVFTLVSGTLPSGLTLSSGGVISGTPTATSSSSLTFKATDNSVPQQSTTVTLTLQVLLSTLTITTASPLPQATTSVNYSTTLQTSGGHPPVTWSLAAGSSLPTGLSLSNAGVISGTATTAGTSTFTVQATDATPFMASQALSLTVVALAPLTVTTTTLPAANLATSYSTTLALSGGASPYAWSLSSGSLPAGLAISSAGVISGTPYIAGSYSFTVQVKDSETTPATATRTLTLVVGTTLPAGASNAQLSGSYAFLLKGFNTGNSAGAVYGFGAVGSLKADGAGNITGTEDLNTPTGVQRSVAITGTYTLGTDGRGFMVLTAGSITTIYVISAGELSSSIAQSISLTEFDNSTGATGTATATGLAKRQTTTAFAASTLSGTFVFGLDGESPCSTCATPAPHLGPVVAAGSFTLDGVSAISTGLEDAADYATNYSGITFTGSFTTPSATTGVGTLHVTNAGTLFSAPPTDYTYVIVSANELLLLSNNSHATTALLAGDARSQQIATYTAASLTGTSIGYESSAAGSSTTQYPTTLNAVLTRFTVTGSGVATLAQDANRAGTFSTTSRSVTYTTAASGRTVIATGGASNQTLYSYSAAAGFAVDQAATAAYPGLITYEQQATSPIIYSGAFETGTIFSSAPATYFSGLYTFALDMGSTDSGITGHLTTVLDSSSPAGSLIYGASSAYIFTEDSTSRTVITQSGSTTPLSIVYGITPVHAVAIAAGSTTTPTVTSVR